MKTIILHGVLAKKFGKSFRLSVGSTKEAMRALCVQLTGFEAFMMNAHKQGLRFAVVTGMGFAPAGAALIGAGVGLMVGGISQMLMPKVDAQDNNQDGNKANKGFGGAVTTIAQGNPVPILYGEREIGGFIMSASQLPEDML